MTLNELINLFPKENSINDRMLLISPEEIRQLIDLSVHENRIFLLVSNGLMKISVRNEVQTISGGHLIDMLAWEPITFNEISEDAVAWCLLPNYQFTNESLNDLNPADSESFKDRQAIPLLPLDSNETKIIERQLHLLVYALNNTSHTYRTELCQTYFKSFMLEIGNIVRNKQKAKEETEAIENRQNTILRSFLKLVWKYYREQHNVEFYAEKLCLSSKHLSRVAKATLGKTAYAVINDELLQRAKYLLKETRRQIQDISAELHFSEIAAFCKFFKKHTGVSPTAYRIREQRKRASAH